MSSPPNSTVTPRASSYAIANAPRGDGPLFVLNVHVEPSHSHVAPSSGPSSLPPNRTVTPRAPSYASPCISRGGGPLLALRVHVLPSHSQVSPSAAPSL